MKWEFIFALSFVLLLKGDGFTIGLSNHQMMNFRARRAAAPRSYMHAEECKGVNRTFPLMDDYPYCQSFVVCDPVGHKYIYDCPSGLWFNDTSQECDYPENLNQEFQKECGDLIKSFEGNFYKKMTQNINLKTGGINNNAEELGELPEMPIRGHKGQPKNMRLQQQYQNTDVDDTQTLFTSRRRGKPQSVIPRVVGPEQLNDNAASQISQNPRRQAKPQPVSITHFSESMPDEYYEELEEPDKVDEPKKQFQSVQASTLPLEQDTDDVTPHSSRNTIPLQDTAQTMQKPVESNNYDYYDGVMPDIKSVKQPSIIQGSSLGEQQSLIQQHHPEEPSSLGQHPSVALQSFLPQLQIGQQPPSQYLQQSQLQVGQQPTKKLQQSQLQKGQPSSQKLQQSQLQLGQPSQKLQQPFSHQLIPAQKLSALRQLPLQVSQQTYLQKLSNNNRFQQFQPIEYSN